MNAPTFSAWVRQRDDQRRGHVPYADRIVPLIAQAGAAGMSRTQLGHAVRLDPVALNHLLDGLVQAGMLAMAWDGWSLIFRTPGRWQASSQSGVDLEAVPWPNGGNPSRKPLEPDGRVGV